MVMWANPMRTVAGTSYDSQDRPCDYWVDTTTDTNLATGIVTLISAVNENPDKAQAFTVTANNITRTFSLPAGTMRTSPVTVTGAQISSQQAFKRPIAWSEVDFSLPAG